MGAGYIGYPNTDNIPVYVEERTNMQLKLVRISISHVECHLCVTVLF